MDRNGMIRGKKAGSLRRRAFRLCAVCFALIFAMAFPAACGEDNTHERSSRSERSSGSERSSRNKKGPEKEEQGSGRETADKDSKGAEDTPDEGNGGARDGETGSGKDSAGKKDSAGGKDGDRDEETVIGDGKLLTLTVTGHGTKMGLPGLFVRARSNCGYSPVEVVIRGFPGLNDHINSFVDGHRALAMIWWDGQNGAVMNKNDEKEGFISFEPDPGDVITEDDLKNVQLELAFYLSSGSGLLDFKENEMVWYRYDAGREEVLAPVEETEPLPLDLYKGEDVGAEVLGKYTYCGTEGILMSVRNTGSTPIEVQSIPAESTVEGKRVYGTKVNGKKAWATAFVLMEDGRIRFDKTIEAGETADVFLYFMPEYAYFGPPVSGIGEAEFGLYTVNGHNEPAVLTGSAAFDPLDVSFGKQKTRP